MWVCIFRFVDLKGYFDSAVLLHALSNLLPRMPRSLLRLGYEKMSRIFSAPAHFDRPELQVLQHSIAKKAEISFHKANTMRLLSAKTLELKEFFNSLPPYAILSHTWGREEVTFHDLPKPQARSKIGYRKIEFACRQIDGYEYAWIDTCCTIQSHHR